MSSAQNNQSNLDASDPKNRNVTICLLCCCTTLLIGFGVALAAIALSTPGYTTARDVCPAFKRIPENYTIEVPIIQFWTEKNYIKNISNASLEVSQVCPSYNEDFALWVDGELAGKTETDFWSVSQRFEIKDCKGNLQFIGKTEDLLQTLSNSLKFQTSFQIHNPKNELVAFVERDNFWNRQINLKDNENNMIDTMDSSVLCWSWYVRTFQVNHPLANPLTIAVIIQKRGYEREKDSCNRFFWGALWFLVALALICLLTCCAAIVAICKKKKTDSSAPQRLNEENNAN